MSVIELDDVREVDEVGSVELVGESPAIGRLRELVADAARGRRGVVLLAEMGSQADAIARAIHARSERAAAPFVRVDCAAPEPLAVERELFGGAPARGNGSGRVNGHAAVETVTASSAVAAARSGTLFLDNLVELPASVQGRLARLARDGEMRVNGAVRPFAARLVASAPPNVDEDVAQGKLRADLFRRLALTRIAIPPLRDRPDDIPLIAGQIARSRSVARGLPVRTFTQSALLVLRALPWRRNVAELVDVIDRLVVAAPGATIRVEDVLMYIGLEGAAGPFAPSGSLREARLRFEREYIAAVLRHHRWRMSDAAKTLGIQRTNLYRKARQLGIPRGRSHQ